MFVVPGSQAFSMQQPAGMQARQPYSQQPQLAMPQAIRPQPASPPAWNAAPTSVALKKLAMPPPPPIVASVGAPSGAPAYSLGRIVLPRPEELGITVGGNPLAGAVSRATP